MTANTGPEPRDAQCPERGPALSHTPDPVHRARCRHCGVTITPASDAPPVPFDVAERLRKLGMMPDPDPLLEPRLVNTPMGPIGPWPKWRRAHIPYGRTEAGELSPEDRTRLLFHVHVVRTRTWEDIPE